MNVRNNNNVDRIDSGDLRGVALRSIRAPGNRILIISFRITNTG